MIESNPQVLAMWAAILGAAAVDNPVSASELNSKKESIINTLQKILKEEWERVKKGK